MIIFYIILLSISSAVLYRFGGSAKQGNWLDFFRNKLTRRLGCSLIQFIAIFFVLKISAPWWIHLLIAGITYGFLTTYWDFLNGKDNHYLHGFGIGLAILPLVIIGSISWVSFFLHLFTITMFMGIWSSKHTNDNVEEYGRGSSILWSLLILFLK